MDIDRQMYLMGALYHVNCLINYTHVLNDDIIDESYLEEIKMALLREQNLREDKE